MKGFSLIELMICVAIVGILAAVAIPMYGNYVERAQGVEEHMLSRTELLDIKIDCAIDPSLDKCPLTAEEEAAELAAYAKEREEETDCCIKRYWKVGEGVMDKYYRYKASGCHMETDDVPGVGSGMCPTLIAETITRIGMPAWRDKVSGFITP